MQVCDDSKFGEEEDTAGDSTVVNDNDDNAVTESSTNLIEDIELIVGCIVGG